MIDKDIEIVKKVKSIFEHLKNHGWVNDLKREVNIDKVIPAIENVLSEFQGLRDFSTETVRRNAELQEELETYKKIAEKLAEELSKHIWLNDKDAILKIYREKVEEDETYS